ncbi:putative cytochrome P450 oxidoreductase [Corynascus similis CBS 632.67]
MEFISSKINATLAEPDKLDFQSPLTVGLSALVAFVFSFFIYVSSSPRIHPKAPAFTSDMTTILGATGFTTRPWSFWVNSFKESKTGNFSFWLGRRHIVGITGHAARKMFYDHPALDFVSGAIILPFGVHFWPPIHDIFKPGLHSGRNNTFFLRRMADLMKTEPLAKYFPDLLQDARDGVEALLLNNPKAVTKPPEIWRAVFRQNVRLLFSSQVANNPNLFRRAATNVDTLLHTVSHWNVLYSWLPAPSYIRRRLARRELVKLATEVVDERLKRGGCHLDDPIQQLIENGDKREHMIEFFVSVMFISTTNAHVIAGQLLNIMAIHPEWQEKVYKELKAVGDAHSHNRDLPLVDKLARVPMEVWESTASFPTFDLVLKETIRMWTSFGVTRLNTSSEPIPIPGSDEVVPGNTFVIYNSSEVNFSEELYPNPTKFDPERFTEGREEFRKQPYGFLGWGQGKHPCAGIRWAKLQQLIIVAHALAMYKWSCCDENGGPDPYAKHRRELDSGKFFVLPPMYAKLEPRDETYYK